MMEGRNFLVRNVDIIISSLVLILVGISLFLAGLCTSETNDCAYIEYPEGYDDVIFDVNGNEYFSLEFYPEPNFEFVIASFLQKVISGLMLLLGVVWGYKMYLRYGGKNQ